ncbi:WXG100 family type VII secretion target [Actinomadura syzygii]|uniref:ESAT-6-like protein n=1 Tax=Actinomadura syzygii TaxID=1427538 RepID=A0A5D0ULF5_9ACTN|nr:WXG100 family type VII secretion target [Actinomadura syzygii]TYC18453.1 WXG100 family type VII secretion target [Actinomadura syzygii]
MTDLTRVHFGSMKQAQASFQNALNEYKAALDELEGKIKSTLAEWEGDAQLAYRRAQTQWNQAGVELGNVVHRMGSAIGESHDGYRTTENRNAASFGG